MSFCLLLEPGEFFGEVPGELSVLSDDSVGC